MLVDIVQRNIENGFPNTCGFCPIALRLEELTGQRWFVGETDIVPMVHLLDPNYTHRLLPEAARAWIRAFDNGERVQPFQFELSLDPSEFLTGDAA